MGGCRCSYKTCTNSTKSTENIHFFHYPVKHTERCKIWIENANKPQFCDLEEDQLRNKVICEVHFEDRWFPNPQKKRLLQGAIPTIDGDCKEETPPENFNITSNINDVQVLPANADGTIFVLETDSLFGKVNSEKVESYIYKNGLILPMYEHMEVEESPPELKFSKLLNNQNNLPLKTRKEIIDIPGDDSAGYNYQEKIMAPEIPLLPLKSGVTIQKRYDISKTPSVPSPVESPIPPPVQIQKNYNVKTKSVSKSDKAVSRSYLRKIKQHSRDIATIKRMLKQKNLEEPDITTTLNLLKGKIAPTLFTLLQLNLNIQIDFTDKDIEFFSSIHNTSPEVYQMLSNKFHWKMPDEEFLCIV